MIAARLATSLVACSALLAGSASDRALALSYEPPDGKAYSGVFSASGLDNFQSFLSVTKQPSAALFSYTAKYPNTFSYPLSLVAERPAQMHLTWRLFNFDAGYDPGVIAGTTGRISRGDIDRYILDRAAELRGWRRPVQLRINHEMNGTWYPWAVRGRDGRLRPDNGHAQYVASWRRAVTLFRGGTRAEINSRLGALGLPPLTAGGDYFAPVANVAFVWCASDGGIDDPHPYYPGDAWVDWVGIDIYSKGTEDPKGASGSSTTFSTQIARRAQSIYDRYSGPASTGHKPFLLGEWGMWSEDDPQWMASMFDWAESRPKVKALLYFNRDAAAIHELEHFPKTARVFRSRIANSRYLKRPTDVQAYPGSTAPAPAPAPDTTGPRIVLSSPGNGERVSRVVSFRPAVTDPSGVERVRFYLDGELVETDAPDLVRYDLDTRKVSTGGHVVRIEATDRRGNVSTLTVSLKVVRSSRDGSTDGARQRRGRRAETSIALTAGRIAINQRISQAALRRVKVLEAELDGRPAPTFTASRGRVTLSASQLRINQRIAQEAMRRVNALAARVEGTPAPRPVGGSTPGVVTLSLGQLRINQRISLAAMRRVIALEELVRAA